MVKQFYLRVQHGTHIRFTGPPPLPLVPILPHRSYYRTSFTSSVLLPISEVTPSLTTKPMKESESVLEGIYRLMPTGWELPAPTLPNEGYPLPSHLHLRSWVDQIHKSNYEPIPTS